MPQEPFTSPIQDYLERLHSQFLALEDGKVATYIPELALADKNWFGICVATCDGQVYEVGETRQPFTIQSISKPLVYGIALADNGEDDVLRRVGVEPTGDAFNSISLDPSSGRPLNPMINAGAIASAGLVAGQTSDEKFARILQTFSLYAGRELSVDEAVYQSEKATGHRNRAIGHMLRNFNVLGDDPEPVLDLYFRQCSISINCRDLALIGATLANGGINPITDSRAAPAENIIRILSIMASCGMYDYAGEWIYRVGIPAKSGVGGGILAVLPGQLGIGVFSPALDEHGNSVRGIAVCRAMSRDLELHLFNAHRAFRSVIRSRSNGTQITSRRLRGTIDYAVLKDHGQRTLIYELQGGLNFSAAELVVRDVLAHAKSIDFIIFDFRRVVGMDDPASKMIAGLGRNMAELHVSTIFADTATQSRLLGRLETLPEEIRDWVISVENLDCALEWCENKMLLELTQGRDSEQDLPLVEHEMCKGLSTDEFQRLRAKMTRMTFGAGETIVRQGDAAEEIYFLIRGEVTVTVAGLTGHVTRVSTLSPGMVFGEMSAIDRQPRSADVRADQDVTCYVLPIREFDRLAKSDPILKATLLENILRHVTGMLRRLNGEVSALVR